MFLHVCVILFTGGSPGRENPPPQDAYQPLIDRMLQSASWGGCVCSGDCLLGGCLSWGETPLLGRESPPGQGEPPREQTPSPRGADPHSPHPPEPPLGRDNPPTADPPPQEQTPLPWEQTPRAGRTPPRADTPLEQTPPPPPQEADCSIRSMSGRYASYWNAFLLVICFVRFQLKVFFNKNFIYLKDGTDAG